MTPLFIFMGLEGEEVYTGWAYADGDNFYSESWSIDMPPSDAICQKISNGINYLISLSSFFAYSHWAGSVLMITAKGVSSSFGSDGNNNNNNGHNTKCPTREK